MLLGKLGLPGKATSVSARAVLPRSFILTSLINLMCTQCVLVFTCYVCVCERERGERECVYEREREYRFLKYWYECLEHVPPLIERGYGLISIKHCQCRCIPFVVLLLLYVPQLNTMGVIQYMQLYLDRYIPMGDMIVGLVYGIVGILARTGWGVCGGGGGGTGRDGIMGR